MNGAWCFVQELVILVNDDGWCFFSGALHTFLSVSGDAAASLGSVLAPRWDADDVWLFEVSRGSKR